MAGTSQFNVRIDDALLGAFRKLIRDKKLGYGGVGRETENAIREYLKLSKHAHGRKSVQSILREQCQEIVNFLVYADPPMVDSDDMINYFAKLNSIRRAVIANRGNDPRTIRRWLKLLEELGFIEQIVNSNTWKVHSSSNDSRPESSDKRVRDKEIPA